MPEDTPFIVYASDSGTYHDFLGRYGKGKSKRIEGSLIVVSGGFARSSGKSGGTDEVIVEGSTVLPKRIGVRFVERVLEQMITSEDRIMYLFNTFLTEAAASLNALNGAGFEVIETGQISPASFDSYAVCTGPG